MFEIEKNVPLPKNHSSKGLLREVLEILQVGESCVIPLSQRANVHYHARLLEGRTFVARKCGDDVARVWRLS